LYSVLLGDTSIPNMTVAIPLSVFSNADVRLRVWFNDGTHGSQLLAPDQRIAAVGYSMIASTVPDGSITGAKIANTTITSTNIANGAVGSTQLGSNLTLAGTTSGAFSGNIAGSATGFTGSLAGNVTGTQSATIVSTVGGVTGGQRGIGRKPGQCRDQRQHRGRPRPARRQRKFLRREHHRRRGLQPGDNVGQQRRPDHSEQHAPDAHLRTANFFAGLDAGNFTMSGIQNTAIGTQGLPANTTGSFNTASGRAALFSNTTGSVNTASVCRCSTPTRWAPSTPPAASMRSSSTPPPAGTWQWGTTPSTPSPLTMRRGLETGEPTVSAVGVECLSPPSHTLGVRSAVEKAHRAHGSTRCSHCFQAAPPLSKDWVLRALFPTATFRLAVVLKKSALTPLAVLTEPIVLE